MKNVAIVNTGYSGSTGKIAVGLNEYLKRHSYHSHVCQNGDPHIADGDYRIGNSLDKYLHAFLCRAIGGQGMYSKRATKRFIKHLEEADVDSIFLLNIHEYFLNEGMLLDYIAMKDIALVYVMIDEYPFLGKCCYNENCMRFKEGCGHCPQVSSYPKSLFFDRSREIFKMKGKGYKGIKRCAFVAPEFVVNKAKTSPLMEGKRLEIVDEAIDVIINKPKDSFELRRALDIGEDKIVIGCVAPYSPKYERKGVKYLVEAARQMENDDRFVFVQVGYAMDDKTALPKNYIPIGYVKNQDLLTMYYSLADLFVFPSVEDTMPNACLEALACGSPLLCFNTSGMPFIGDETVMTLVEPKNVGQMVEVIKATKKKNSNVINTCRNYALNRYDNQKYYEKLESIMNSLNHIKV